ncbi:MAG: hypothetical protein ACQEWU_10675 [Bacillota bacterium]|uniref:Uncharacterized protein n=1 Tax=Virgibacillus salarius TaxID=447199 RepID=A0A941DX75_9BACI|nr:hypothetical protein [Virgibacillus salarius]MBR7796784.1 hypothetical protein [Virgibacillus salarius]NAZ09494.1 hypothetical protein [Agaribacter marinus]WBX81239.1 hypothetical protein PD280_05800 [Virgibacillus salarius]
MKKQQKTNDNYFKLIIIRFLIKIIHLAPEICETPAGTARVRKSTW